jgi:hypothetical protein
VLRRRAVPEGTRGFNNLLTQHSTTPTSAKPALVGDPGHVLGYDCDALRAEDCRLPPSRQMRARRMGHPCLRSPVKPKGWATRRTLPVHKRSSRVSNTARPGPPARKCPLTRAIPHKPKSGLCGAPRRRNYFLNPVRRCEIGISALSFRICREWMSKW